MKDACSAYREVEHFSTAAAAQSACHVCVLYSQSLTAVLSVMGDP